MKYKKNRREIGQGLIETAFGAILLIVLLGGLIDVGRAFIILIAVENAAGEGALYGATHPECVVTEDCGAESETIIGRVMAESDPITIEADKIEVSVDGPVTTGTTLTVNVTYNYAPLTPLGMTLWGTEATVTASASQPLLSGPRP